MKERNVKVLLELSEGGNGVSCKKKIHDEFKLKII
jgi:hypothetical protein